LCKNEPAKSTFGAFFPAGYNGFVGRRIVIRIELENSKEASRRSGGSAPD
jgi:hypothetical protein